MGPIQRWLDRIAITLSSLCLVHCIASVVLAGMLASAGTLLLDPHIHEYGLAGAIALAALGLGLGLRRHGRPRPIAIGGAGLALMAAGLVVPHGAWEAAVTIAGVALVALAHRLNGRFVHAHAHNG